MNHLRGKGLWFVLGVLVGMGALMAMGAASDGDVGRYQLVPVVAGNSGLFIVDTKTGVTKIVWGAWSGGQMGKPFTAMVPDPK